MAGRLNGVLRRCVSILFLFYLEPTAAAVEANSSSQLYSLVDTAEDYDWRLSHFGSRKFLHT